jgi:hypothetical protein
MPKGGFVVFGDLTGKIAVLRIHCDGCDFKSEAALAELIGKYGPAHTLLEWKAEVLSGCPRRAPKAAQLCGSFFPDISADW